MTKIEWKLGAARLRNGGKCEIVAVLPSGRPVVSSGPMERIYCLNGHYSYGYSQLDLLPPRERVEGYLWVKKDTGALHGMAEVRLLLDDIQNIPIALERDGPKSDWEIVK